MSYYYNRSSAGVLSVPDSKKVRLSIADSTTKMSLISRVR